MAHPVVSRRHFISAAFAGTAAAQTAPSEDHQFDEPAQKIQLCDDADVIVCGAGPAGIAAAITAARAGARTRLFEVHGCLGHRWFVHGGVVTHGGPDATRRKIIVNAFGSHTGHHADVIMREVAWMRLLNPDVR